MYTQTLAGVLLRDDGAFVPADPENRDYQEFLAWVRQGNAAAVEVPAAVMIAPISPRQIRQALTRAGLRQLVEGAVAAGDQDLKDWWEFSTSFERSNPQVVAMGAALGQTVQQLDGLWVLGESL